MIGQPATALGGCAPNSTRRCRWKAAGDGHTPRRCAPRSGKLLWVGVTRLATVLRGKMLFGCGHGHRRSVAGSFPQPVNDGKTKRNQAEHKGVSFTSTPSDKFKNESREQKKDANANRIPTSPAPGKEAKCAQEHDHGDNPRHNHRSNRFAIIAVFAVMAAQEGRVVIVCRRITGGADRRI